MPLACKIEDCERPAHAQGLCDTHYRRFIRGQLVDAPIKARIINGPSCRYRRAVEKRLGRKLLPKEIVHHDDENRANNAPDNLVLCPNRGQHALLHKQARIQRLQEEIAKGTLWKKK